jgi:hypothetical protein
MYTPTSRRRNEDVVRAILGKPVATSTCSKKQIKKIRTGCAASQTTYHGWSCAKLARVFLKKICGGEGGIGSVDVDGNVGLFDEAR